MRLGFFLVLKTDVAHYLHACALVREARLLMPTVASVQLTDSTTPEVVGVTELRRQDSQAPLLEQRLTHYASLDGEWALLDTDTVITADLSDVFDDPIFDVALCDRDWPHVPQGEQLLQAIPFNTGVVFTRCQPFWQAVLETWQGYPESTQRDWMSEQRAVYDIVRSGRFKVKILPGAVYNYPPAEATDVPESAVVLHFKGPSRKRWRSDRAVKTLGAA